MQHILADTLVQDFVDCCGCRPRCAAFSNAVSGSRETTFRIGGAFEYLVEPDSPQQLSIILKWLKTNGQSVKFLGYGSNLLVNSEGIKAWVVRLGKAFSYKVKEQGDVFKIGAINSLTSFAREVAQEGFSGLEFAAGIPASVGGAVRMNAGAHHSEIANVLCALEGFNSDGDFISLNANELSFSYRHCSLPQDFFVTAASFRLVQSDTSEVMARLTKNLEYRKKSQPLTLPSAGSIFRNPSTELSAGALIEKLGLKGFSSGNAVISELHANWIVNPHKKAKSADVLQLIETCKKRSAEQFSIELQPELVVW